MNSCFWLSKKVLIWFNFLFEIHSERFINPCSIFIRELQNLVFNSFQMLIVGIKIFVVATFIQYIRSDCVPNSELLKDKLEQKRHGSYVLEETGCWTLVLDNVIVTLGLDTIIWVKCILFSTNFSKWNIHCFPSNGYKTNWTLMKSY